MYMMKTPNQHQKLNEKTENVLNKQVCISLLTVYPVYVTQDQRLEDTSHWNRQRSKRQGEEIVRSVLGVPEMVLQDSTTHEYGKYMVVYKLTVQKDKPTSWCCVYVGASKSSSLLSDSPNPHCHLNLTP